MPTVVTRHRGIEAMGETDVDVVVVGAGFAGIYLLHELREHGFSSRVLEAGDDVGGTWYWNRYPGARCDISTTDYQFTWDPELHHQWSWSEKHATQPEILRYAQFVARKHDLYSGIDFGVRVTNAVWDEEGRSWAVSTSKGETIRCRFYVMATGCLSVPKEPDLPGVERFDGEVYVTGWWPHEGVDFSGRRVAVIGTGSSAIQSIPIIADQAASLTVFQRTPNYSMPALNGPPVADRVERLRADRAGYEAEARMSMTGVPYPMPTVSALAVDRDTAHEMLEAAWNRGELLTLQTVFTDASFSHEANEVVAEFIRSKIREVVQDPDLAETLSPRTYPFGTKRPCMDTGYYETFTRPHVRLIDLNRTPIHSITETGIDVGDETIDVDAIVYATGFDAMTGALVAVDITGSNGVTLKKAWEHGPLTYLGLATVGFPNLFMVTGPGSPSVFSNMMVSIEQHVEWIRDTLIAMREEGFERIEATPRAQEGWRAHGEDCADLSMLTETDSWYMGANVPGKPRVLLPYAGGVGRYRRICDEVMAQGLLGFSLDGPQAHRCRDGVVREIQPDVEMVLDVMAQMELPAIETLSPVEARAFSEASAGMRPSGPDVGEILDGTFPGPAGDLAYRLYRPLTPGPHPIVVYFHGGGWLFGSQVSDDPLCRDLCVRSGVMIVSVDYRHAPEDPFPAAPTDAYAAVEWVSSHAEELGGDGRMAVAGWSAGGNLAAVVSAMARDRQGPRLEGQLLLTPVTDGSRHHGSYDDNAEGYMLTRAMMDWFWDHYATVEERQNPAASPLLADSFAGLPPAMVITCQYDPLRDEGDAYAEALARAGVPVTHVRAGGHIHTSLTMVDVVLSGRSYREQMAGGIAGFFSG